MKPKFILLLLTSFLLITSAVIAASADDSYFASTKKYDHVLVERVVSADTIILEGGEKIKLIGLKAPRPPRRDKQEYDKYGFVVEPSNPITPMEEQAFDFVKSLLEEKYVRLEFDAQKKTDTLETFAYVYLDDLFVNTEILRQGFADLQIAAPNLEYADLLRSAYREARTEKRGLHNDE